MNLRLVMLKYYVKSKQLDMCSTLLDKAGVPEWVLNTDSADVPANAPHERLRWFLARRKDVKPHEVDQKLQAEMKQALQDAKDYCDPKRKARK